MLFRRFSPLLALVAALVLIAGPAPSLSVAAPSQQLQKVAYGSDFLISGTTAPIYIAIEKGYFAEGGIEVTVSRGFGSADRRTAVTPGVRSIRAASSASTRKSRPRMISASPRPWWSRTWIRQLPPR